jgi:DNA-directed RNA polymerase sigma subunit (sigma70/sigma32)
MDKNNEGNELFRTHTSWAEHVCRGYCKERSVAHHDRGDFINVGLIGLWQASERYDATVGAPFKTYARCRVVGAMSDYSRDCLAVVRVARTCLEFRPTVMGDEGLTFRVAKDEGRWERGRLDAVEELNGRVVPKIGTERRRRFLAGLMAGKTAHEIADGESCSPDAVWRMMYELRQSFN